MNLLGYTITPSYPNLNSHEKTIVNTINPHSYCVAKKDEKFKEALQRSHFLLPDGIGIVKAAKMLNGVQIERIAGYDVFMHLMQSVNNMNGKCFFLGASEETLKLIEVRASKDFPNISLYTYSPPYKVEFTEEESLKMCEMVNNFKPDVLFVGMTAPKQEKWVYQNQENLRAKVICSIGAVFDFYAGTVERPSLFWQKLGLEWLPRLLKEPKRLWRRNFISTPTFIIDVYKEKFKSSFKSEASL